MKIQKSIENRRKRYVSPAHTSVMDLQVIFCGVIPSIDRPL